MKAEVLSTGNGRRAPLMPTEKSSITPFDRFADTQLIVRCCQPQQHLLQWAVRADVRRRQERFIDQRDQAVPDGQLGEPTAQRLRVRAVAAVLQVIAMLRRQSREASRRALR